MNTEVKTVKNFADLGVPSPMYKYRDFRKEFDLEILTANVLYFSSPSDFADKNDCKGLIRYDLLKTESDKLKFLYNRAKEYHPEWQRAKQRQWVREMFKRGALRDTQAAMQMQAEEYEVFCRTFGVLSMCAHRDRKKLWNDFAGMGTGFCVGFDSTPLFSNHEKFGGGGVVTYEDPLPIIYPMDDFWERERKRIFVKLTAFEKEEEYRLIKFKEGGFPDKNSRKAVVPTELYKQIIMGPNISKENRKLVTKLAMERFPYAELWESNFSCELVDFKKVGK